MNLGKNVGRNLCTCECWKGISGRILEGISVETSDGNQGEISKEFAAESFKRMSREINEGPSK